LSRGLGASKHKVPNEGKTIRKLTERFMGPYQVKGIISTNVIELDLPRTVKIYSVVNVSRVCRYKDQVEGQKKE